MVRDLREIVDKLVNGFFEYENRKLTISESRIELSLSVDEVYKGSFHLTLAEAFFQSFTTYFTTLICSSGVKCEAGS